MKHPRERRRPFLQKRRRVACLPCLERLETRQLLTTTDNIYVVTSTADSGVGSLRDAINWANSHANISPSTPDIINFNIPNADANSPSGFDQEVIQPLTPLPVITDPVVIDGSTESGWVVNRTLGGFDEQETDVGVLTIRIDGARTVTDPNNPSAPLNGITIAAPNCSIDGLSITGFKSGAGIELDPGPTAETGAVGDLVYDNFIGVASFNSHTYNYVISNANPLANGVGIKVSSSNNRIGATLPPGRNIIQGNNGPGIWLFGPMGNGNEVEGSFILDNNADGVLITTSHNFIGEPIGTGPDGGGDVISGNTGSGVHIVGPSAEGNVVVNSEIGTNIGIAGATPAIRGMYPRPNVLDGILIEDSPGNTIGGTVSNAHNVLASNGYDGLRIENNATTGATDNQVLGNEIGFNLRNGIIAILPNRDGININSSHNTIGGTVSAARNIIINNARNGITISGIDLDTANVPVPNQAPHPNAQPSGNVILGNFIGTQGGGDRFGNTLDGILFDGATDNTIGGTAGAAANIISANNNGVVIAHGSSGNVLLGNEVGTTADGLNVLGNSFDGVLVSNSPGTTIGGTATGAGNVLSGNKYGVRLTGGTTTGTLLQGNLVGTDLKGAGPVRNAIDGVLIDLGASSNTVGGTVAGAGNTLAYNVADGIAVLADPDPASGLISTRNALLSNSLYFNNLLGIDLGGLGGFGGDGVTLNHPGGPNQGPNDLQNFPVLTSVAPEGVGTNVQGTFNSAANATFTLQFFSADSVTPLLDGQGQPVLATPGQPFLVAQGKQLIGSATVMTDASGNATFSVDLGINVASGKFVTATATSTTPTGGSGDTSEFSNALPSVPVTVQFQSATYSVNEANTTATITVTRSGGSGGKVLVSYASGDGTAVSGTDYTGVADTLTFSPNETTKSFNVPILDAQKVGGALTINLTLSSPTGGATLGAQPSAVLTIQDNEPETLQFSAPGYSASESDGKASITVTRNTGNGSAAVTWGITGGSSVANTDYSPPVTSLLTFIPGQTAQTIIIPLLDDHQVEGNESINLALTNPTAGALGAASTAVLTIQENDHAGTLQFGSPTYYAYAGGGAATVSVTRTGGADGTVAIGVNLGGGTARAGVDYSPPVSTTLIFNPGETSKLLQINVAGPHPTQGNPTLNLSLQTLTGGAILGTQTSSVLTIVENGQGVGPVNPSNDHVAPTIQGVNLLTNGGGITGVVLHFSKPLDPNQAQDLTNYGYFFLSSGPDGVFGTLDDSSVPIASAMYDPRTLQVILTPQFPLALGLFYQLNINRQANPFLGTGLTDLAGNLLDGSGAGIAGSTYSTLFGLGSRLQYFDSSGNNVSLQLSGGFMTLFRAPNGDAVDLQLIGTVRGRSTLTGSVHGPRGRSKARTPLPFIEGTAGVRVRLKSPPFLMGARR